MTTTYTLTAEDNAAPAVPANHRGQSVADIVHLFRDGYGVGIAVDELATLLDGSPVTAGRFTFTVRPD